MQEKTHICRVFWLCTLSCGGCVYNIISWERGLLEVDTTQLSPPLGHDLEEWITIVLQARVHEHLGALHSGALCCAISLLFFPFFFYFNIWPSASPQWAAHEDWIGISHDKNHEWIYYWVGASVPLGLTLISCLGHPWRKTKTFPVQ